MDARIRNSSSSRPRGLEDCLKGLDSDPDTEGPSILKISIMRQLSLPGGLLTTSCLSKKLLVEVMLGPVLLNPLVPSCACVL